MDGVVVYLLEGRSLTASRELELELELTQLREGSMRSRRALSFQRHHVNVDRNDFHGDLRFYPFGSLYVIINHVHLQTLGISCTEPQKVRLDPPGTYKKPCLCPHCT